MVKQKPYIASVTSGKGGVGKTFVSVNLATTLARVGKKVLVVDSDLGLANIDIMLGINPRHTLQDVIFGTMELKDIVVPTKGGFDLIPSSSGVREMAQLLLEKIEMIKSMILSFTGYDIILLDTGAGISEVVLQFNLLATKNIVIINRELTCLTDAYAMIKVMFQVFGREAFSVVVNAATGENEANRLFSHLDGICKKFLGFSLHYLGYIAQDDIIPRSILKQELAVMTAPNSLIARNFKQIAKTVASW
ncbi:MAG: AAA family ATPase [Syntrophales bacterium LBB04]|nr:AAA family ATPase [Syntrophales bacterium LBB04]